MINDEFTSIDQVGPFTDFRREPASDFGTQLYLMRAWDNTPLSLSGTGIICYRKTNSLLGTRVLTCVNQNLELPDNPQIHIGGYLDPTIDTRHGYVGAAWRELFEETGFKPRFESAEDALQIPEITRVGLSISWRGHNFRKEDCLD